MNRTNLTIIVISVLLAIAVPNLSNADTSGMDSDSQAIRFAPVHVYIDSGDVALAAWHVTQFYVFLFAVGMAVIFFLKGRDCLPRMDFTIFTAATAAAAVMLPVLRAKQFVSSPQMMICYGLVVIMWLLAVVRVWGGQEAIAII